jgi:membrane protein involved in colicin uptake
MENQLTIIDLKEFGLEKEKAVTIQTAFEVKVSEREALANIYQNIITKEISPELVEEANELRKKLVKVRTGIAEIHKTEKAFYLAAGKFCDALKNKHTLPVSQMEEKLKEIVDYYENIEKQRLEKLRVDRWNEIKDYTEHEPRGLEEMEQEVFDAFKSGLIAKHEARLEAERKAEEERLEAERVRKLVAQRELVFAKYSLFCEEKPDFATMEEDDFIKFMDDLHDKKVAYDEQQAEIKAENERLRKEAEEKAETRKKRAALLQPYIVFIRDYNALIDKDDKDFNKEFAEIKKGAEEQWKFEREEKARKEKEEEKARQEAAKLEAKRQAELKAEREKQAKLEAELKAKKEAEAKAEAERLAKEKAAKEEAERLAKAPIKEKLTKWVNEFQIADAPENNEVSKEITARFNGFKSWAINQINNL